MMVRKKLAVVVAALGALQTDVASALGLGELSLNSALNQPLEAEIKLLDTGDLDPTQVLVELGAKEDFDRAGVSRDFFLSNLRFNVEIGEDGKGVIKINTRENVIEPYLDFIIEARWPSGRILREYTVLLDLPTYSAAPAPTVTSSPVAKSIEQQAAPQPTQTTPQRAIPPQPSTAGTSARESLRQGDLNPGDSYRVQRDETLWEIAAKSKPPGSSVQQTMLGIQRLNPNAFIKGNINRLKAGYVLRLPTEQDMGDISERIAKKEVANQNQAWKTGESMPSALTEAPLDASSPVATSDESVNDEARLSIAGSGSATETASDGVGSGQTGSAALNEELSVAEENLDQAKRHNDELAGRLSDMEAKMATLQRLLELKEDQLAALQASKGEPATAADAVAPVPTPEPEKPAEPPKPQATPSFVDELLSNPIYLGAAGGIIALAVIAAMVRRRKQAADEQELSADLVESESDDLSDLSLGDEDLGQEVAVEEPVDAEPDLEEANVGDFAAEDVIEDAIEEQQAPIQSETGDAIAEADIYIAYGRFQQAMDLLTSAHSQEPQRSDVLVKLLEVCLEARDKPGFQQHYVTLQALGDEGAIIQVKEMLSTVDGVADWLDDLPGSAPSITDADMDAELIDGEESAGEELDLDIGSDTLELDAVDIGLDDEDMDLDLDLDLQGDDLDEMSESRTMQFDTQMLEEQLGAGDEEPAPASLELDDLGDDSLSADLGGLDGEALSADLDDIEVDGGLDLDLSDDLNDLEAELDTIGDESDALAAEEEHDLSADLELAVDLDTDDLEPDLSSVELDVEDDPLDVDLSGDLGDLELSPELDDLEAELDSLDGGDQLGDLSSDISLDDELSVDLDSDDASLEPLSEADLSTQPDESEDELDLSSDIETDMADLEASLSEEDMELGLDGAVADLAADDASTEELATQESFDEPVSAEEESEDEFDFLADTDEVATKLDLARAYIDMGDTDGAKDILDEVVQEGNEEQKQEANSLLERV